jgi:flagellar motor protein MotB
MKRVGIFASISLLSLACATCTLGYAQSPDQRDKPADKQQDQDKHRDNQQHNRQVQQHPSDQSHLQNSGLAQQSQRQYTVGHLVPVKQVERSEKQQGEQQLAQQRAWPERRANHYQYERHNWQQRGGYHGLRVSDDYFRDHYGSAHGFRIYGLPFVYEAGNPRFQYEGYWFTLMDPYPENWEISWYQNDDVYVDYQGDGYYLFNRRYPGHLGIALNVSE